MSPPVKSYVQDVYKRQIEYQAHGGILLVAAIQTMKRSDKQKEPAALIFSKAAGSKWARGYAVSYTHLDVYKRQRICLLYDGFFSFAVVRQVFRCV